MLSRWERNMWSNIGIPRWTNASTNRRPFWQTHTSSWVQRPLVYLHKNQSVLPATVQHITSCGQFRRHLKTGPRNCSALSLFFVFTVQIYLLTYILWVQKKWAPNILHWPVQTCPILNKIKHAVAQKYLSYCCLISYNSIIPLNRLSIFTNCFHRFQLPTWLAYYTRHMSLRSRMTSFSR